MSHESEERTEQYSPLHESDEVTYPGTTTAFNRPSMPESVMSVMIAQWKNECVSLSVLPVAWVQFPTMVGYFKGFFPG